MEEQEEEVVFVKVFDEVKGDVVFEGKVLANVAPDDLVQLRCFWDRGLSSISKKATNEEVKSFKGLRDNVELVAGNGVYKDFSGVLYVGADGALRKSKCVPSCPCKMMIVWHLSHEECQKAFECATLEELEVYNCKLRQIPDGIVKMKKLKKLRLYGLIQLKIISEDIGELSNLEFLLIGWCEVESLPKRLKELKMLKSIRFVGLYRLRVQVEDLVVFSRLKKLRIDLCIEAFTPSFAQSFWEMIKSKIDLCMLDLDWNDHNQEMVVAALEENGSIVDGGEYATSYRHIFKRNKANHEKALQCVVYLMAIRRWRDALNGVPKEMVQMLAMALWNTKCDVNSWT